MPRRKVSDANCFLSAVYAKTTERSAYWRCVELSHARRRSGEGCRIHIGARGTEDRSALGLGDDSRGVVQRRGMKKLFPYFRLLKPVKFHFIGGLLFGLLYGAASGFGLPFLIYKAFPVIFADPTPALPVLIGWISIFPVAMLVRCVSDFGNAYLISFCGLHVLVQVQKMVHEKLQRLELTFFHKNTVGDLLSRTLGDTAALQTALTGVASDLIKQPVTLLGAVGALIYLSFQQKQVLFILLFIVTVALLIIPLQVVGRRLLKRARQVQDERGGISRTVNENLSAAKEVRAFNLQEREIARFDHALKAFTRLSMKVVKYGQIMQPTIEFAGALGVSVAIVYVLTRDVQWGEITALFASLYMAYDPVKKFGKMYQTWKNGEAALQRIEYILHQQEPVAEPEHPAPFENVRGDVGFENVSFRYLDEWVLKDVSVSVPAGTVAALVGPSGAGKSTFVDLIPRFYDVQQGRVSIDGHDVRSISKKDLRGAVSMVAQDTFLFNETIAENIRVGRPEAADADVVEAAKHAFAHDFILAMENGYETVVGERGVRLSGGQKQRIAIARAFLKSAPVLILDEATSALDSESEEMIQRALEKLVEGKTVFIIAHRFSTIKLADRILVFDKGVLRGSGTHAELYESDNLYRGLYDRQFIE